MKASSMVNEEDAQFLIELVDTAGLAIMDIYARRDSLENALKADSSPLTQADLVANQILVSGLQQRFPEIPVLSEESRNTFVIGERPQMYWAVDPLDGTKEFIKGNGEFTVNVALVVEGVPQLGLIGAPALSLFYFGAHGFACDFSSKAQRRDENGWQDIRVSDTPLNYSDGVGLRVAMSRSHASTELEKWLTQFSKVIAKDVGSSLKFCLVAEGAVDVYPRFGPTCIWDTAAGHAIVVASGGRVVQVNGAALTYREPAATLNSYFMAYRENFHSN
jgi:3'(2'), 5'-bisphosphate nucleotidase